MISALVTLLIVVLICALLFWIVSILPLPDPFRKIANVIMIVIFALVLIFYFLLPLAGHGHSLR